LLHRRPFEAFGDVPEVPELVSDRFGRIPKKKVIFDEKMSISRESVFNF